MEAGALPLHGVDRAVEDMNWARQEYELVVTRAGLVRELAEMARAEQQVTIVGRVRVFAAGERIHTENSYKYAPEEFETLLRRAGFDRIRLWQDRDRQFSVFYAQ